MNDKFGTTKLLTLPKDAASAASVLSGSVAVRLGSESSGIALVDSTDDAGKLLIFQITHTQREHRSDCIEFLASSDDKAKIRRIFVDRVAPEFAVRLPDLIDRIRPINFAEQVPKSVQLLVDLKDCHDDILYPAVQEDACENSNKCKASDSCAKNFALLDSSVAGSHFTKVSSGHRQVKSLSDATHTLLTGARQALGGLLLTHGEQTEDESVDCQLTRLLHNMTLSEHSEATQSEFASCVQPALQAYADVIEAETDPDDCWTVYICDCIFNSQFCREALLGDFANSKPGSKTIRFVKDIGLLGFLGALVADD